MKKSFTWGQTGFVHLLPLLLILIGIVVGVFLVTHPTFFKPKASFDSTHVEFLDATGNSITTATSQSVKIRLTYIPSDPEGQHCGGNALNLQNLQQCPTGYACTNTTSAPAGDVGGTCHKVSNPSPTPSNNGCDSDSQCPSGQYCQRFGVMCPSNNPNCGGIRGVCTPKPTVSPSSTPPSGKCLSNNDCQDGQVCVHNAVCPHFCTEAGCPPCYGSCVAPLPTPSSSPNIVGPGAHCGGFIQNPPQCAPGLTCVIPQGAPPDSGGTCQPQSSSLSCSQCVINNRPDLVPYYQKNGWNTSPSNYDNIVNNWCTVVSPEATQQCSAVKSGVCNSSCSGGGSGVAAPAKTSSSGQGGFNLLSLLGNFVKNANAQQSVSDPVTTDTYPRYFKIGNSLQELLHSQPRSFSQGITFDWTLTPGDGQKTVYLELISDNGRVEVSTGTITLKQQLSTQTYDLGVLVLKYFPLTQNGQNIDINVTGDIGDPYSVIKTRTDNIDQNLLTFLPKATQYLGYKNPSAPPSLKYHIVDTKEFKQAVPIKARDGMPTYPDYNGIMQSNNICDYVDNKGVREVWLWAYQGPNHNVGGVQAPYLGIFESKMSSPFGDISNSYRFNDMPVCQHTYRVYTFNYQRGTAEAVHSWGHQIEAELDAVNSDFFRNKFQGPNYPQTLNTTGRCGSVHNPPNARSEYDWANPTPQASDCLNWNPDGLGSLTKISCQNWGCQDIDDTNNAQLNYIVWNWQNLPGLNNDKTYQGKKIRNLWDIHGDFDNVMANDKTIFASNNPGPSPTSTVVITCKGEQLTEDKLEATLRGAGYPGPYGLSFQQSELQAYNRAACPAETTVTTCKGEQKTWSQLDSELKGAGYPGPYDHASQELDAYTRAACPVTTVNSCSQCIIKNRPDLLPFYQKNGWKINQVNWDNIVNNWCSAVSLQATNECIGVKSGVCASACNGQPSPSITPQPTVSPTPVVTDISYGVSADIRDTRTTPGSSQINQLGASWIRFVFPCTNSTANNNSCPTDFHSTNLINSLPSGVKRLAIIDGETSWNAPNGDENVSDWNTYTDNVYIPTLRKILQDYGSKVDAIEVWNEEDIPNRSDYKAYVPPAAYAHMLSAAASTVKSINPNIQVISGGLGSGNPTYLSLVKSANPDAFSQIDGIAIHPYHTPENINEITLDLNNLNNVERQNDIVKPTWVTEIGIQSFDNPTQPRNQTEFLTMAFNQFSNANPHPKVAIWYAYSDLMGGFGGSNWGVVDASGLVKVNGSAFASFAHPQPTPSPTNTTIQNSSNDFTQSNTPTFTIPVVNVPVTLPQIPFINQSTPTSQPRQFVNPSQVPSNQQQSNTFTNQGSSNNQTANQPQNANLPLRQNTNTITQTLPSGRTITIPIFGFRIHLPF